MCLPRRKIPSIDELFGDVVYKDSENPIEKETLASFLVYSEIYSVATLMMLTPDAVSKVKGLKNWSELISKKLAEYSLAQYSGKEPVADFLEKQFGSLEETPIGVLQVSFSEEEGIFQFNPLLSVGILECDATTTTLCNVAEVASLCYYAWVMSAAANGYDYSNVESSFISTIERMDVIGYSSRSVDSTQQPIRIFDGSL